MLSLLYQLNLAGSRCGVPLISELLQVCLNDSEPLHLEQALIWLGLLHGLDKISRLGAGQAELAIDSIRQLRARNCGNHGERSLLSCCFYDS